MRVYNNILLLFLLASLGACGGGGGSDNQSQTSAASASAAALSTDSDNDSSTSDSQESALSFPNILLIVSDDQGLDASSQYSLSLDTPTTPTLDTLATDGLVFDNVWATPACATTRAAMISGLHGVNNGVDSLPGLLDTSVTTIQSYLRNNAATSNVASAVVGKWHLAGGSNRDTNHPNSVGIDYYAGNLGNIDNYFSWELTENGVTRQSQTYHSTAITNLAIDWIAEQSSTWFLWLAYSAPHTPLHLPPEDLHSRILSGDADDIANNPREYYLAAIEAMDTEIGRLLESLPAETRDNTLVIFVGDNGTPQQVIDISAFPRNHGKGTLYEGGLKVPLVISGAGIERENEREDALVHVVDLFPTIVETLGGAVSSGLDGDSILPLLGNTPTITRTLNYAEYVSDSVSGWAVRNDQYKLIEMADGVVELFDLSADPNESEDILAFGSNYAAVVEDLQAYSSTVRAPKKQANSGDSSGSGAIDITNAILTSRSNNCEEYQSSYTSNATDVANGQLYMGALDISLANGKCIFSSNAIPNHDFNDGDRSFVNAVQVQDMTFEVPASPAVNAISTEISLQRDNAVMLNGVKVDLLAAGCYGIADGKIGCNDLSTPWRYDPANPANGFGVDSHNAHTQPDGSYHYHGSPNALFDDASQIESPVVGFAADGFPIYGSYFNDGSTTRRALSSYQLRSGTRASGPGGSHDGTFIDDYEYVPGSGDLDECNGMFVGDNYGYYITEGYPYVLGCFRGTPDDSFLKRG
ncbi:MAG: YHYH protein [Halioglobus sp.]